MSVTAEMAAKVIEVIAKVHSENPMGIEWFRFDFEGRKGYFTYQNKQGEKKHKKVITLYKRRYQKRILRTKYNDYINFIFVVLV